MGYKVKDVNYEDLENKRKENREKKIEVGSWKLEVGSWKLEVGSWKLEQIENFKIRMEN